ncbi:proline dehydrogenase family protein [Yinghuangia seranimata]|uniref:proline dehydrogenase family protein n=1 Tax=Yinghuangia seranimata TaxID=408067 RepID=UPI00248AE20C|nr:proline dehydrogenase family protein [Yinghuangia seranimata]MDI2132917.1 proline dehydrogenase family protein [Yinghuangia seranimata]
MLRQALLSVSRSTKVKNLVETAPGTRALVHRFVAGDRAFDAVRVTERLAAEGLYVSIDHLGEDTLDPAHAHAVREAYLILLGRLDDAGLAGNAEVSVKLSALGRQLPVDGAGIALDHARAVCEAAKTYGTTVTLDAEDHTTTDTTLDALRELRADYPWVGAVVQAYLRRTEADCRDLATAGSRVRLCKGAYREPESVAFPTRHEVDLSYVRCLKTLMAGPGYPMVATHDPRLIELTGMLAARNRREPGTYEFQMLYGVRPGEQVRLAAQGERVRVYVPYGDQWYGYLMRRLAERPANLTFFLRSLATRR